MKQSNANRKVNEQAREILASILLFEVSDPRLRLVTITGCEVSFDRSVCNVFYTTEPERYDDVAAAFQKAAGRIRSLMARKLSWRVAGFAAAGGRIRSLMGKGLSWRVTPELRFHLDPSVDEAEKITDALARDAARNAESAEMRASDESFEEEE